MDDTSNLKETLDRIDAAIEKYNADIELGKALKRLKDNPDFQKVIMNGYIDSEAKVLFKILTDPSGASPYPPEQVHLKLEAISHFKGYVGTDDYLGTVMMNAEQAQDRILREEMFRKEVTATFANDGDNDE